MTVSNRLFDPLFGSAETDEIFGAQRSVQTMLDVEAALAMTQAELGLIPKEAAQAIARCCDVALFDFSALAAGIALAGNSAIPVVKALTALVSARDATAGTYVHWGATSQDVMDTALVLQLKRALALVLVDANDLSGALADLCGSHRHSVMAGRTWMQQALPVTLGLKAAGWLDAMTRHRIRLREVAAALPVQFGGAVGTLAASSGDGRRTAAALAKRLELATPDISWHASRDVLVNASLALAMLAGTLGKIASDISLLMQTEIDEAAEPSLPGRGGSSTMPHKRNPVACAVALAAAVRVPGLASTMLSAMVQQHERGLGGWHAEWETVPEIARLVHASQRHMLATCRGLNVNVAQMHRNLERTNGLIMAESVSMALTPLLGREQAHATVESACRHAAGTHTSLSEALLAMPIVARHLSSERVAQLTDPANYLGETDAMIDAVLARHRTASSYRSQ